jgi:hypothetical protein
MSIFWGHRFHLATGDGVLVLPCEGVYHISCVSVQRLKTCLFLFVECAFFASERVFCSMPGTFLGMGM